MSEVELLASELPNPDPRSFAMSRAAELREEGMSPSEALSEAWSEIRDGDEDIDFDYDDDDEDEEEEEIELPVAKSNRRDNPDMDETLMYAAMFAGAGYLGWCAYASRNRSWTWTPWKANSIGRRYLPAGRRNVARRRPNLGTYHRIAPRTRLTNVYESRNYETTGIIKP